MGKLNDLERALMAKALIRNGHVDILEKILDEVIAEAKRQPRLSKDNKETDDDNQ